MGDKEECWPNQLQKNVMIFFFLMPVSGRLAECFTRMHSFITILHILILSTLRNQVEDTDESKASKSYQRQIHLWKYPERGKRFILWSQSLTGYSLGISLTFGMLIYFYYPLFFLLLAEVKTMKPTRGLWLQTMHPLVPV